MFMLGTIVNAAVVAVTGTLGSIVKKGIPERVNKTMMHAVGLFVIYLGVSGSLVGENALVSVISLAVGALIGELIDIDKYIHKLGEFIQSKVKKGNSSTVSIADGFASCTILFCVGAMAILGAIEDAQGNPETLFAKAVLLAEYRYKSP